MGTCVQMDVYDDNISGQLLPGNELLTQYCELEQAEYCGCIFQAVSKQTPSLPRMVKRQCPKNYIAYSQFFRKKFFL